MYIEHSWYNLALFNGSLLRIWALNIIFLVFISRVHVVSSVEWDAVPVEMFKPVFHFVRGFLGEKARSLLFGVLNFMFKDVFLWGGYKRGGGRQGWRPSIRMLSSYSSSSS